MRRYEAMVVMDPFYNGDDGKSPLDITKGALEKHGAQIEETQELGKKKLAYEIHKRREGTYVLFCFNLDAPNVSKVKRAWTVSDAVLTYMLLQEDEVPVVEEEVVEETPAIKEEVVKEDTPKAEEKAEEASDGSDSE